jgi:hypothetical protein
MNAQRAIAYFVSLGWTPAQAAGIVANLFAESHLNPEAVGDGGQAYGIAQWHADRQAIFASVMGKNIRGSSVEDQLAFVHSELNGNEKAAGDALRACVTATEAGACVSKRYERPGDAEGEAARRGALAAKFAGEQPAETPPVSATQQPGDTVGAIAIPLLTQLLPQVLQLFSGRAQAQIAKATGSDPAAAGQFLQSLITQVGQAVGVPVTDAPTAIQAVAAVTAQPPEQQAATVAKLEQYSLDQLAPLFDKLHGYDKDTWAAEIAGRESAARVAAVEKWDMTPWLVWFAGGAATLMLLGFTSAIIYQAIAKNDINTGLIGVAGPLLAIGFGVWREIFAYRFDGSKNSSAQTAVLSELASKGSAK